MINEVKKMAVEMMFWPACPVDDDYCFDAIMRASVIDRKFEDEHGIYLHEAYREICTTSDIKNVLKKKTVKLLAFRCEIEPAQANKMLMKEILRVVEN